MSNKLKDGWNWFIVGIIYLILRIRWFYFHVHPSYHKVWFSDTEAHFFDKRGHIHSDIKLELTNGKVL